MTNSDKVAVSSRVRIARNLSKYKFPQSMTSEEADLLTRDILQVMKSSDDKYRFFSLGNLSSRDRVQFVEEHLISPTLLKSGQTGSFLLRDDKKVTIMLNEEDHIRVQVLSEGFNIDKAYEIASEVDDFIEKKVDYAFDEKFGYLTSCPTNVGTGLRASVMLHLPAITMTKHLDTMVDILTSIGLTLRGIYGEGSKGLGCLYQISNQTTIGIAEEDILIKLNKVIEQIISREEAVRKFLLEHSRIDLEDRLFRSYGIITNNRKISSKEAMKHLSNIKLAFDLNLIEGFDGREIIQLMEEIQPGKLQAKLKVDLEKDKRDIERSKYIRSFFKKEE